MVATRPGSQKALAIEALTQARGPLRVSEIADELLDRGYRHWRSKPIRPNQLLSSLSSLLQRDPAFVRIERGKYDLARGNRARRK